MGRLARFKKTCVQVGGDGRLRLDPAQRLTGVQIPPGVDNDSAYPASAVWWTLSGFSTSMRSKLSDPGLV